MNQRFLLSAIILIAALFAAVTDKAHAGVSISVGEPGFYGRLDIGNYPPPRLIYSEPVIVRPVRTWYPPIYLRVPPGHAKKWYRYCDQYQACGRPVYFVDDVWYRDVYAPRYREYNPRVYAPHRPPVIIHKPTYYEYRKYDHRPPKKIYIQEDRYKDHRGKDKRYKDKRYKDKYDD